MNVSTAIETRRAVKHFDPAHRMTDAEVNTLFSAAIQSPTAFNIQNWRFVLVRDPGLRAKIRAAAFDQAQVTDASLLAVICADLKSWEKDPGRYWKDVQPEVRNYIVPMIDGYYRGREQVQRDEAMRSSGIAAQTIMLMARSMGYDSCPMDGFDFDAVAKLINLPPDHCIAMFVAVGKSIREPWPKGGQLQIEEVVITDRFPV